jgi:hypothetical protein
MRPNRVVSGIVGGALLVASLVACGGSFNDPNDGNSQQCFTRLSDTEFGHFQSDLALDPNAVQINQTAGNIQSFCLIDDDGNQRQYARNDGFDDFLTYALLASALNGGSGTGTLLTAGVLSGTISPFEALAINALVGVDSGGRYYRPYQAYNGSYRYQPDYDHVYVGSSMRRVTVVKTVYVGRSTKGMSYGKFTKAPPKGYAVTRAPKVDTGSGFSIGDNGRPTVLSKPQVSQVTKAQSGGSYGSGNSGLNPSKKYWDKPSGSSFKKGKDTTKTTTKPRR